MKEYSIWTNDYLSKAIRLNTKKIIASLVLILCFGISPAWGAKPGAILYVNASAAIAGDGMRWETAFTDLQHALDAAVSGDEIWVAAGTYKPTNSSDRTVSFILKSGVKIYGGFAGGEKALRERSSDPSLTILSGDIGTIGVDTDNSYHVVYADGVTGAVLDGFTVTLGRGEGTSYSDRNGAGMYNYESSLTIANCIFRDNQVAVKPIMLVAMAAACTTTTAHRSSPTAFSAGTGRARALLVPKAMAAPCSTKAISAATSTPNGPLSPAAPSATTKEAVLLWT